MVPCMARRIVGRSRQLSVGAGKAPVRLPCEISAVAGGAGLGVDRFAAGKVGGGERGAIGPARRAAPKPDRRGRPGQEAERRKRLSLIHSFIARSRKEFPITDTEERLMAAAAIIGDRRTPKIGNRMPAATGTPAVL
ncbi:hypothetical protein SAMN05421539_11052 [Jannaschia seohaensis]|uniref:Uncharacterized protein n=1 Tax=Jannaschia seohaensis TaxID=475081 RepID=A0A2Y9B088_9RHOB|nr:hypothetical protein BCF38_11052 [Jannaschia seohaensis]SSA49525.1 hypothetical protein SAMN05421539_11052 [Jannaschia seohaensis]